MQRFGEAICKHRKAILIIALLLLIPTIIGIKMTKINYDILVYLPEEIETVQGENILSADFNMGAFSVVIVEDMKTKDILKLEDEIKKLDNVQKVFSIADVIGTKVPTEMLPEEIKVIILVLYMNLKLFLILLNTILLLLLHILLFLS